jgi:hypothetical protein
VSPRLVLAAVVAGLFILARKRREAEGAVAAAGTLAEHGESLAKAGRSFLGSWGSALSDAFGGGDDDAGGGINWDEARATIDGTECVDGNGDPVDCVADDYYQE